MLLPVVKHSLLSLDNADVQRSTSDVTVQDPGPCSTDTKCTNSGRSSYTSKLHFLEVGPVLNYVIKQYVRKEYGGVEV